VAQKPNGNSPDWLLLCAAVRALMRALRAPADHAPLTDLACGKKTYPRNRWTDGREASARVFSSSGGLAISIVSIEESNSGSARGDGAQQKMRERVAAICARDPGGSYDALRKRQSKRPGRSKPRPELLLLKSKDDRPRS